MDYDQREDNEKRFDGRPVGRIKPVQKINRTRGAAPASGCDREDMRIKAWDAQRSAQLGRKWNYKLTRQMLYSTVAEIDLEMAATGSPYALKVREGEDGVFIELSMVEGGAATRRSEKLQLRGITHDGIDDIIKEFLKKHGVRLPSTKE